STSTPAKRSPTARARPAAASVLAFTEAERLGSPGRTTSARVAIEVASGVMAGIGHMRRLDLLSPPEPSRSEGQIIRASVGHEAESREVPSVQLRPPEPLQDH